MSNWSGNWVTRRGRELLAKVGKGGNKLEFTKMKLGDGTETLDAVDELNDLVSPKLTYGISSLAQNGSTCTIVGVVSSETVSEAFQVRENGLFAKDPDLGEILFAINLDNIPDTLISAEGSSAITIQYAQNLVFTNAADATAVIDPTGLVTTKVLAETLDKHNAAPDAHENRFSQYLPLAGGVMRGAITVGNFPGMRKATDREETYVYGGTTNKDGAAFGLRGVNCTEYGEELRGSFGIAAVHPSGAVHILNGLGNGSLLWDGINIGAGGIVAQSIGRNGYIKLGNGLILQWGYAEQKGVTPMPIAFPIAFPSLTLSLVFGEDAATNDMLETAQYVNLTNHGFTFYGSNMTLGNLVPGPCKAFWLALGY